MTHSTRLAAISIGALLFACASQTTAPPPGNTSPSTTATPASVDEAPAPAAGAAPMFACAADTECVVLEMGCCDHCNGGWRLSVNQAHTEAATTKHHEKGCAGACTERGCDWNTTAVCHEGACALSEDRSGSGKPQVYVNEPR